MCQMPNIWHIYHTKHQKRPFIRCVKRAKLLQHAKVPLQFWHGMDRTCIIYIIILFSFSLSLSQISLSFSVFSYLYSLLSLSSLFVFHSTPITNGHHSMLPISPKTTTRHRRPSVFSIPLRVFFFFSFFLFSVHFFWLWFDGWVRMGKLVVGGFKLWVMAVGGLRWWWANQWWLVGRLVMGKSVVGESVMANRWWCQSLF